MFTLEVDADTDAKLGVEPEGVKAPFEPYNATSEVNEEAEAGAECGVGCLEFLGVEGRDDFGFECLGVGGREVLGVVGFEFDADGLRVTGVERAI